MKLIDIQNPANWRKTGKKSYEIWVCMPQFGTKVHNHLEKCDYVTNENTAFVLSGTQGEQWCISGEKLAKTYTFATGEPITLEALQRRSDASGLLDWTKVKTLSGQMTNYAFQLPYRDKSTHNFPVQTSWGSTLLANARGVQHGDGDYLVCSMLPDGSPNLQDVWVVNGLIFPATYNLRNFNVTPSAAALANMNVPKPVSLIGVR